MNYFCHHCGHKLITGGNFCANCGTPVAGHTPAQQFLQSNNSTPQPIKPNQDFSIGRFGNVRINFSQRTFHIELYEEMIVNFIFKGRFRGKCIINKTLSFSQLVNYKIIDTHDSYRAHKSVEKYFNYSSDFKLGIELYIDDEQGYYYINFGLYGCIGTIPPKEHAQAKQLLGILTAALEIIKNQQSNT